MTKERFLRVKEVAYILSIHPGTVYKYVRLKKLPPPLHPFPNVSVWPLSQVENLVQEIIDSANAKPAPVSVPPRGRGRPRKDSQSPTTFGSKPSK